MSLESDDLEDCIKNFRDILYKQEDYKMNETDMWSLIENLANELELSKKNEICLQKNLEKCLENENGDITTHYVHLREKCTQLEEEMTNLKVCLEDLQMQVATDVEMLKNDFMLKLSEVEQAHKHEVSILKEKMENKNKYHEAKERELYEELQLAQATSDLRCDEIESNLTRQLFEANNKLKVSQNVIRSLQADMNGLKNQLSLANHQIQSYKKPPKPEIRFQPLPVTTCTRKTTLDYEETRQHELEFDFQPSVEKIYSIPNRNDTPPIPTHKENKLCPTPNRNDTPPSRENKLCPIPNSNNTPLVTPHREFTRKNLTPKVYRGSLLNLPKTNIASANTVRRKRKLYDPESFDESNIPQFSQNTT